MLFVFNQLWSGAIPAVILLSHDEISTASQPRPFFAMLSRQSYLPLVAAEAVNYFKSFVPAIPSVESCGVWFEHAGIPLKWYGW